jgi:hypothetical protein
MKIRILEQEREAWKDRNKEKREMGGYQRDRLEGK